jgi:V8-like Glu-specific endopeptidase
VLRTSMAAAALTLLAAGATAAPALAGTRAAAAQTAAIASSPVEAGASADAAIAYWTPARLRAAQPAAVAAASGASTPIDARGGAPVAIPGEAGPVDPGAAPAGVVTPDLGGIAERWTGPSGSKPATNNGRIYFSKYNLLGQHVGDFWCSGSVVVAPSRNLVITAGHCVHGGLGYTWNRNEAFIPGYVNGNAPFGVWPAHSMATLKQWTSFSNEEADVGFVVLSTDSSGHHIAGVVGSEGIAWNQGVGLLEFNFGYPAEPPFDGQHLMFCSGIIGFDPYDGGDVGIPCNMNGGSSGGPWLMQFDGINGLVNSVNAYGYPSEPGTEYGPYFGKTIGKLYTRMSTA